MPDAALIQVFAQSGSMGLLVFYLMWREVRREKLDRERIEADKALAVALTLLEASIKGLR